MRTPSITRRGLGLGIAAAGLAGASQAVAASATPPVLTHVFDLTVEVGPAQELGEVGGGRRRVIPITGGSLIGPGLVGEILPGGADWQTIRPDGVTLLQARYTVRMRDGATIGIINTGVRRADADVVRRLTAGEDVDPSLYYFRATPVFEVGPGPYLWLTENLFVSAGARRPRRVELGVFKVA
ncbi:DUF3237 domain-containing protein [Caulobacter segnis]